MYLSEKSSSEWGKGRILVVTQKEQSGAGNGFCGICARIFLALLLFNTLLAVIVYFAPIEDPQLAIKVAPHRPRPKFEGNMALNEQLDKAELLFENQFHAPESMAWRRTTNETFYTGVEGGFILEVNPYSRKWSVVAQLNSPKSDIVDEAEQTMFTTRDQSGNLGLVYSTTTTTQGGAHGKRKHERTAVKYCTKDVELYGEEARNRPGAVRLSRCSRPLGVRLAPDESYLYAVDPLSGLYRINLTDSGRHVRLIDFDLFDVRFADDLAVKWGPSEAHGNQDTIYISDCSRRLTLRYLIRMMIEYDDTGRILEFSTARNDGSPHAFRELKSLSSSGTADGGLRRVWMPDGSVDSRNLSFPNGVELTANQSALLVSDLNNRRILMHHLEGPLSGQTNHLLWVPGYPDNIKRGRDTQDGRPTYWLACGCAVSDWDRFEVAEFFNHYLIYKRITLKLVHYVGASVEWLGHQLRWSSMEDAGLELKAMWLKKDPYCTHGLVMQFDETGRALRTLHAPHFSSKLKIVSEAHEVPERRLQSVSHLFIGSVYYSYLGHLELPKL